MIATYFDKALKQGLYLDLLFNNILIVGIYWLNVDTRIPMLNHFFLEEILGIVLF